VTNLEVYIGYFVVIVMSDRGNLDLLKVILIMMTGGSYLDTS
jgi:hypothetical protein